MNLLNALTTYCAKQFHEYGNCRQCSHPSGMCSSGCLKCSEEINFHEAGGRRDYDCEKFIYYYMCRYSWKYCSEIIYALEQINLDNYPGYAILSIGCGGAPDLMAFDYLMPPWDTKDIYYTGYDMSSFWSPIHKAIEEYTKPIWTVDINFNIKNIFDALRDKEPLLSNHNIIILQYLLSHFPPQDRVAKTNELFDGLLQDVLLHRWGVSPFLFLINDIDHCQVRDCFDMLLQKLRDAGYHGSYQRRHFSNRSKDYNDGSIQYPTWNNKFQIPEIIKDTFNCAINCTSAQMIVEVKQE